MIVRLAGIGPAAFWTGTGATFGTMGCATAAIDAGAGVAAGSEGAAIGGTVVGVGSTADDAEVGAAAVTGFATGADGAGLAALAGFGISCAGTSSTWGRESPLSEER